METVKDTASWGALIGALLPFLIAIVQQPRWSSGFRQIIAVVVSVIAGVGTVLVSGNFDVQNWLVTLVAVIGAAQAAYALVWRPTNVAPTIEAKTAAMLNSTDERGVIDLGQYRTLRGLGTVVAVGAVAVGALFSMRL
jgi:hypothetical protein